MSYKLVIGRRARTDLVALHRWISDSADNAVADDYLGRLDVQMQSLRHFPHRGTTRSTIRAGLRSVTFERRMLIVYTVDEPTVTILRVVDARRDWAGLLSD